MKNDIYDLLNDIDNQIDTFENIDLTSTDLKNWKQSFASKKKASLKKHTWKKYVAAAAAVVLILGGSSAPVRQNVYAQSRQIMERLSTLLGVEEDLSPYSTVVGKSVSKNGITVTLNEVILDGHSLIISYKTKIKDNATLKNLNIKLGGFIANNIYISTDKLKDLKGLTDTKGKTTLKITDTVTDRNEKLDFLKKGDGVNGINSINKIHFSENDDTINLNNLNAKNSEIIKIYGESGNDYFITSLETLGKIEQLDGGKGGEENSLEITDSLILDDQKNSNIFENVFDIEKLVLSKVGNIVVIDNLVSDDPTQTFSEVIGTDGGENGNTFIIDGIAPNKKEKVLGMKIEGGVSSNDTLKVNTEIETDHLLNKTGIENLERCLNKDIKYHIWKLK